MTRGRLLVAALVVTTAGYVVVLATSLHNPAVVLLAAVPIVIAGGFFGLRFVAVFTVALAVVTFTLIEVSGPGIVETLTTYRGIPIVMLLGIGLVVGRLRDLTGRLTEELEHSRKVEEELRSTQTQLEGSLVEKDKLIASLGHELRTPLTAVLGFAELLRLGNDTNLSLEDRQEMVNHIANEAFDLSAKIDDLLVAARIETGSLVVTRVPTSLRAQVAQVTESWDPGRVDGLEIVGDDVRAVGDPARVRQILRNLLTNAFQHGGDQVTISMHAGEDEAIVAVADNGAGLPQAEWERIFEPYHGTEERSQPASLGLGLTVSRQLAELMKGSLAYEHRDGLSTFTLRLPRTSNGQPTENGE